MRKTSSPLELTSNFEQNNFSLCSFFNARSCKEEKRFSPFFVIRLLFSFVQEVVTITRAYFKIIFLCCTYSKTTLRLNFSEIMNALFMMTQIPEAKTREPV